MRSFEFFRATEIADAVRLLGRPGARVLAGGTTLVDLMKLDVETPRTLIDITALPLTDIQVDHGMLRIGALVSNADAASHALVRRHAPGVSAAILSGASGQIRNAATMGGNLLQRTRCSYFRSTDWPCNKRQPGTGCSAKSGINANHAVLGTSDACMAVNPSDLAVALLATDAQVILRSATHERVVPLADFYRLPGATPHIETAMSGNELITQIDIPTTRLNSAGRYLKLRSRASYEFASASVASAVIMDENIVRDVAIAIGGLGVKPWRDREAEKELLAKPLTDDSISSFCDALLSNATPVPANVYKLSLARGAIQRVLSRGYLCEVP